jgi:hypothetical protein
VSGDQILREQQKRIEEANKAIEDMRKKTLDQIRGAGK